MSGDSLTDRANKVVADWPDLTAEQLHRIAGILKAAGGHAEVAP